MLKIISRLQALAPHWFKKMPWSKLYAALTLAVLSGTTIWWSLLGARVQQTNADQLVNSFLFESSRTFHDALLPSAHSFLVKWPVFWLVHLCHSSQAAFQITTIGLSLVTVGSLAFVLYKIERRKAVWGTWLLGLAAMLMLVPAQPYAGGLLPVNMAMIATRNVEYVIYIAGLVCILRWHKMRQFGLWAGVTLLGVLFASDRLFLTMSLIGSVLALIAYALFRQRQRMGTMLRWLACTSIGAVIASGLLWLVNATRLTHISAQSDSPFSLVTSLHDVSLGLVFGGLHIFTNLGANPVFDAAEFRDMPHELHQRLLGLTGPVYIVNLIAVLGAGYFANRLLLRSLPKRKITKTQQREQFGLANQLALLLLWSGLGSFAAFVITAHYYIVDARYLGIFLFAIIIAAASYLRQRSISRRWLYGGSIVFAIAICIGAIGMVRTYTAEQQALQATNDRTNSIIAALKHRPVHTLVGDYWRVMPIKMRLPTQRIQPLDSCVQPRQVLSSSDWRITQKQSFGYLLSFDKSLTNYPHCDIQTILKTYGAPSQTVVIAGSPDHPQELLLYFNPQVRHQIPTAQHANGTVLPIAIENYPHLQCPVETTVMNIVAHQDDDLLFTSPDLLHTLQQGSCVRSVYITVGDGGHDSFYWLARERGSEAAYSAMLHSPLPWVQRTVKLASHEFVVIANPLGNNRISLIFMHLPDGNIHGEGFSSSQYESLEHLQSNAISTIRSVDGQSTYSLNELHTALTTLVNAFQPTMIRTQAPENKSRLVPDHSDHVAVGKMVVAISRDFTSVPADKIDYYVGYPIRTKMPNINTQDLQSKVTAFLAYARFDGAVCHTAAECASTASYGNYLRREYTVSQFDVAAPESSAPH